MGILVLLGCLLAVSFAALLTLFLRHRALLTRFARVIDVDREVTAQRPTRSARTQARAKTAIASGAQLDLLTLIAEAREYREFVALLTERALQTHGTSSPVATKDPSPPSPLLDRLRDVHEPVCVHLAESDVLAVPCSQEIECIFCPLEVLSIEMMLSANLENSKSRIPGMSKTMDNIVCHKPILPPGPLVSTSPESTGITTKAIASVLSQCI